MQIKSIILYNHLGDKQIIPFKLGEVNIIRGNENTGKSAIIPIIEYCLGKPEFEVPGDVIQATVAWYAVLYQFDQIQVFIAKQAPGKIPYRNQVFYKQDTNIIIIPEINELKPNSDDYTIKQKLLEFLHNTTEKFTDSELKNYIETTIDNAIFYLFQKQATITDPEKLFHRQNSSITKTLPYFLGVIEEDFSKLNQDFKEAQRDLEKYKRQLKEREEAITKTIKEGKSLIEEAKCSGLIPSEIISDDVKEIIDLLKTALQLPDASENLPFPRLADDDRIPQLDQEIKALIQKDREYDDDINTIKLYEQEEKEYADAVDEHVARLESINLFEGHSDLLESNFCPFCFSLLQRPIPKADSIRNTLKQLQENLKITKRDQPRLERSIERLKKEQKNIRQQLRQKRAYLNGILEERNKKQEINDLISNTNKAQFKVRNRIEYYLEHFDLPEDLTILQKEIENTKRLVEEYQNQKEKYLVQVSLNSILSEINNQMTIWAERLGMLHKEGSKYQFDLDKLTIFFGKGREMTSMQRMGGHKNVLGCHLMLYLALHKYFIKNRRPIPHFLILDQPAQGYFPSFEAYKEAMDYSTKITDHDFAAVQRMFDFLFDISKELGQHFQLIILEHANLPDSRFQNALIENWTGLEKNALIPQNWIHRRLKETEDNAITQQIAF